MAYCIDIDDIESFEYVDNVSHVYDITVKDNHNFHIDADKPILVHNSGKTYSILQVLFILAIENPSFTITVAGQDIPNLKRGAIKDAETIVYSSPMIQSQIVSYNRTDKQYHFKNRSKIEFASYDNYQDAKNGKREILFVNEANGIDYNIFFELDIRTTYRTYIDYNPNAEFWVHEKVLPLDNVSYFISNYQHNPFVSPNIIDGILRLKELDPQLWRVYGLGQTGKIQGLVFDYKTVNTMPPALKSRAFGLDFGFTNDPTTLVECGISDGQIYGKEHIYQTGLTNSDINRLLKQCGVTKQDRIFADAADPKSIQELRLYGWNIRAADKGPDSVKYSIDLLRQYGAINITQDSYNWIKEAKAYKWKEEKTGSLTNQPIDAFNHAWDACRYWAMGMIAKNKGGGLLGFTK